ncbi:hypothetical protein GW943_00400 [Candidatus Parcubacteria bacterium]|uniref:Uncharacterized protein n=1 Tax=Candidatus Kaiserbacteria bacterium CG10_big_fil_rev_8_21_14_0_10_47_16 TaxID=1974608 RepID=A0A2H0UF63_9BACT|nr:hypothetical protein [Candidatus Parcubacteria bacterium]PIR84306.1 MAG: hypothetical protein COU16_01785 [Candidatus Kaiserbacteria bacterium CG10_big_fil_rev_8_21_14_0_10_47_16]
MESDILKKLSEQDEKLDAIWRSAEKTRKMFLFTMWGTIIAFVLPLLALAFVIPSFINSYLSSYQGLL